MSDSMDTTVSPDVLAQWFAARAKITTTTIETMIEDGDEINTDDSTSGIV